jgi:hypothetical protein
VARAVAQGKELNARIYMIFLKIAVGGGSGFGLYTWFGIYSGLMAFYGTGELAFGDLFTRSAVALLRVPAPGGHPRSHQRTRRLPSKIMRHWTPSHGASRRFRPRFAGYTLSRT